MIIIRVDNGSFNDGRSDKLLDRINHFSIHDSTLPQYHDRIGRDLNCACASRHSLLCEPTMKFRAFCSVVSILVIAPLGWRSVKTLALTESNRIQAGSSCPSYFPGVSPNSRPLVGCRTGPAIGNVDHVQAFGFRGADVDLRSCDLPEYPETKYITLILL